MMALFWLMIPSVLIPVSLDVARLDGLKYMKDAGANVAASIVPPRMGLGEWLKSVSISTPPAEP